MSAPDCKFGNFRWKKISIGKRRAKPPTIAVAGLKKENMTSDLRVYQSTAPYQEANRVRIPSQEEEAF